MSAPRPAQSCAPPPCAPARSAFFLDLDGTLAEIAHCPGVVRVDPQMLELLERLRLSASGALAIISGRSIASVDGLLAPLRLPAAGQHGAERRCADGRMRRQEPPAPLLASMLAAARTFALRHPGLLVEEKGLSFSLHFRGAPALAPVVGRFLDELLADAGGAFEVQAGKMVFELVPAGQHKGVSIDAFMAEPPFAGRVPVFLGDDLSDERGFAVVNAFDGHSVKIGAGDSCARWRLSDVAQVKSWLEQLVG